MSTRLCSCVALIVASHTRVVSSGHAGTVPSPLLRIDTQSHTRPPPVRISPMLLQQFLQLPRQEAPPPNLEPIKFSLDGTANVEFQRPFALAFDQYRGLLFVADSITNQVQAFSSEDGSFVSAFGSYGDQDRQFRCLSDVVVDHAHNRLIVVDAFKHCVQAFSLADYSLLASCGTKGSGELEFNHPRGLAIDHRQRRILVTDSLNSRVQVLSLVDLSYVTSYAAGSLDGIAIDDERGRIVVTSGINHQVRVLSLIDGSLLLDIAANEGAQCNPLLKNPRCVCIDNHGRIIVADNTARHLIAYSPEGHRISSFDCRSERPYAVAFDEHRGLIAFSASHRVHVIGANQWLADTFTWRPDRHRYAPSWMKQAILTMTMIRSLVDGSSAMSMIPNELLFEIFSFL